MISIFKEKYNNWRIKGCFVPSSRFLVNKMVAKIEYHDNIEILQLGYGNGVFTKQILTELSSDSKLTIFEVDENCKQYLIQDDRIKYIEDSAVNISKHFENKKFDLIISTLPLASLPKMASLKIQDEIKFALKKNGKYLQFQYSLYSKNNIIKLYCKKPIINFVLLNLPPAFIYEIHK